MNYTLKYVMKELKCLHVQATCWSTSRDDNGDPAVHTRATEVSVRSGSERHSDVAIWCQ